MCARFHSIPTGDRWETHRSPSYLLWDYPDFCLGGRRGPSAYMPFSPGRVRRHDHSLFLTQDKQENLAKAVREIQKVLPTPKREAAGSHTETVPSESLRRLAEEEAKAPEGAHDCMKQRGWAYFLPSTSLHRACRRAPGREAPCSHLQTGTPSPRWA